MSSQALDLSRRLFDYLGLEEEPFAIFYSNDKPAEASAPLPGPPVSRELEAKGLLDRAAMGKSRSCFFAHIFLARRLNQAAYISKERYGCAGGGYFSGYLPYLQSTLHFVSTGQPGITGESYLASPEAVRAYLDILAPSPAPAAYCVAQPLSAAGERADMVVFFARPEVIAGLHTLAVFTTGDPFTVMAPFGAGCAQIISWPYYFKRLEQEKAVLGGFDPTCRPFLKSDELSFTVPLDLYKKMLAVMDKSFLVKHDWQQVLKKIQKNRSRSLQVK